MVRIGYDGYEELVWNKQAEQAQCDPVTFIYIPPSEVVCVMESIV